jgi:hypothetical protein
MPKGTSRYGASIYIDTHELKDLARDLRKFRPESYKEFRGQMKKAALIVVAEARGRARYSKQIPPSIKPSLTASGTAVSIKAGGTRAPNAAPIENKGKGFVRHPVFGDVENWTSAGSHPAFLSPSVDAKAEELTETVAEVVDRTFFRIGFDE